MNLSFILNNQLNFSIGAGILSIIYGLFLAYSVLKNPKIDTLAYIK